MSPLRTKQTPAHSCNGRALELHCRLRVRTGLRRRSAASRSGEWTGHRADTIRRTIWLKNHCRRSGGSLLRQQGAVSGAPCWRSSLRSCSRAPAAAARPRPEIASDNPPPPSPGSRSRARPDALCPARRLHRCCGRRRAREGFLPRSSLQRKKPHAFSRRSVDRVREKPPSCLHY